MSLIGIAGPARSGKDTVADYICDSYAGFVKLSFATPLKAMLVIGLGLTDAQLYGEDKEKIDLRYGRSPRDIMQTLGTEWGRDRVHPDLWLICLENFLRPNTVIADVRFENEAQFIRDKKGLLIHVERSTGESIGQAHASEGLVTVKPGDGIVTNDGTLEELYFIVSLCLRDKGIC